MFLSAFGSMPSIEGLPSTSDTLFSPPSFFPSPIATLDSVAQPANEPGEGSTVCGYTLGSVVGYGATATIRKGHRDNAVVAVKLVPLRVDHPTRSQSLFVKSPPSSRPTLKRLQKEEDIWRSLCHEHVLPLFSSTWINESWWIAVTLWCPAGTLLDYVYPRLFRQLTSAVVYLHEVAHVVHRDLKLENVMVDEEGGVRVGDWGMARRLPEVGIHRALSMSQPAHHPRLGLAGVRHRNSTTAATHKPDKKGHFAPGSVPYAAPELFQPIHTIATAADVWALGVILFALVEGRLPFWDAFEPRMIIKIRHGDIPVPTAPCSRGTRKVLRGCMERDLAKRWTARDVDESSWEVVNEEDYSRHRLRSRSRAGRSAERSPMFSPPLSASRSRSRAGRSMERSAVFSPPSSASRSRSGGISLERSSSGGYRWNCSPSVLPTTPVDSRIDLERVVEGWEESAEGADKFVEVSVHPVGDVVKT
ncbi:kinase-like domain-containing protein [Mucidula mucida]|nr:kinase-like domain-containing protein [Mucidula mucida]